MLDEGVGCVGIYMENVFVGYALQRSFGGSGNLSVVLDVHFCLGGVPKHFSAFENDRGFCVLLDDERTVVAGGCYLADFQHVISFFIEMSCASDGHAVYQFAFWCKGVEHLVHQMPRMGVVYFAEE